MANEMKSDCARRYVEAFIKTCGYRNILAPSKKGVVTTLKPPCPALIALCNAHAKLLRRRLREEVLLGVHWQDGDEEAVIYVLPASGGERHDGIANLAEYRPFETFRLRFPPPGLYVAEPGCPTEGRP
jgi:hypothetical protein